MAIDLEEQTVTSPSGKVHRSRSIRAPRGPAEGLDEIAITLQRDREFAPSRRRTGPIGPGFILEGITHERFIEHDQGRRGRRRGHRSRGDGAVAAILDWFAFRRGVPMQLREAQYGLIPYLSTGKVLPEDTAQAMDEADAILWGATGGPETKEVPAEARKAGGLGEI